MTITEIYNILTDYINKNKTEHNIEYGDSVETLEEVLRELKREYAKLYCEEHNIGEII